MPLMGDLITLTPGLAARLMRAPRMFNNNLFEVLMRSGDDDLKISRRTEYEPVTPVISVGCFFKQVYLYTRLFLFRAQ